MSNQLYYEVLIIGAGPVGLFLGGLLQKNGIQVLIVDKKKGFLQELKGPMLHAKALELMEIIGVTQGVINSACMMKDLSFYVNSTLKLKLSFSELATKHPYYLIIPQYLLEEILCKHYVNAGGQISLNSELLNLHETKQGINANIKDNSGFRTIQSRFVIGCDGAKSTVRKAVNINFAGNELPMKYILAEGKLKRDLPRSEASMYIGTKGVLSAIPLPNGQFRIAGPGNLEHKELSTLTKDKFENYLKSLDFEDRIAFDTYTKISDYSVSERIADKFCKNRVALAGDAAHIHSPAGGQAITAGFQDAYCLSTYLIKTLNSNGNIIPQEYHLERYSEAQDLIKRTNFFKFIAAIRQAETKQDLDRLNQYGVKLVQKLSQLSCYSKTQLGEL